LSIRKGFGKAEATPEIEHERRVLMSFGEVLGLNR